MLALGWWCHWEVFFPLLLPSVIPECWGHTVREWHVWYLSLHGKEKAVSFPQKPEWAVWEQWLEPGEGGHDHPGQQSHRGVTPGKYQKLFSPNSDIQVFRGLISLKCFLLEKIVFILNHKSDTNTFKWHQYDHHDHLPQYSRSGLVERVAWCGHMIESKTQVSDTYSWTLWLQALQILVMPGYKRIPLD